MIAFLNYMIPALLAVIFGLIVAWVVSIFALYFAGKFTNPELTAMENASPNDHSPECNADRANVLRRFRSWVERNPYYCRLCHATGITNWIENLAPHGAGFWGMEMSESCRCTENAVCPRCGGIHAQRPFLGFLSDVLWEYGKQIDPKFLSWKSALCLRLSRRLMEWARVDDSWLEEPQPCRFCGWNWGKGADDYAPALPEYPCLCELEKMKDSEREYIREYGRGF